MEVKKTGKYEFLEDYLNRGTNCVGTIPKGSVVEITQVDELTHKVISPDFYDWHFWELPVKAAPNNIKESTDSTPIKGPKLSENDIIICECGDHIAEGAYHRHVGDKTYCGVCD